VACSTVMVTARATHTPSSGVLCQPTTSDTSGKARASKRRTEASPKNCPVCGSSLNGRKATARFCSGRCRAAGSRMSKAQDFEGLLERMKQAELALHQAADDLADYRKSIELKIGKVAP
jgi:hypothetical protein